MKNVLFYAVLFAFLLISGCTGLLDSPQPEPVNPGPAPEAELPEPLLLQPAPDSEVILTTITGTELVLSPEARLDAVLALLQEALYEANRPLEWGSGEGAAGHITFFSNGSDLTLYLFRDFIYYAEKAYYIAPQKIEQLLAFFEEPPREPVEIEGLVLVSDLDDSIILDIKYATTDNFTGEQVYSVAVAAINKDTGSRFLKAVEIFCRDGYTVKLWDAYRPLSASINSGLPVQTPLCDQT